MKKIKIVLAAVICSVFALTSCSNDDDSGVGASIVGKWNPQQTVTSVGTANQPAEPYVNNQVSCGKDYIEFADPSILKNVVWNKDADGVCSETPGTVGAWAKTGDVVTVTGGSFAGTYKVTRLTGSELRLAETGTIGGVAVTTTIYFAKI